MNSNLSAQPPTLGTEDVTSSSQTASSKPEDISIANDQQARDQESLPDMKEAEVLDAYGNEEGAEVKCR